MHLASGFADFRAGMCRLMVRHVSKFLFRDEPFREHVHVQVLCKKLRLEGELDFKAVAARTPGFVGADLRALTKEAAASAIQRIFQQPPLDGPAGHESTGTDSGQALWLFDFLL